MDNSGLHVLYRFSTDISGRVELGAGSGAESESAFLWRSRSGAELSITDGVGR